jgi:hypothetical protein
MEITTLKNDITVFYVKALSFPEGIMDAHNTLRSIVPFSDERRYFGLSRPEHGPIEYKAAAEELEEGESEKFGCEKLVIKKGRYVIESIKDYTNDPQSIERTFRQLLAHPHLDPQGYCVEWYVSETQVKCMIRLEE